MVWCCICGSRHGSRTLAGTRRYPDGIIWEGMEDARQQGDRIGVLLDLDQGSTLWNNGGRRGDGSRPVRSVLGVSLYLTRGLPDRRLRIVRPVSYKTFGL